MMNKIKIGLLLIIAVNGLWAMNRFSPLLRRYSPSNVSTASNRVFSTSGNMFQAFPGASFKSRGHIVGGYRGVSAPKPGAARKMALLRQKIQEEQKALEQQNIKEPKPSIFSRARAWDKKTHEFFKESFVGTSLLGLGVMIGGRSLYDKYVANKDIKAEPINQKIEAPEPVKNVIPETPKGQEQSYWTRFSNSVADGWNAFTQGVTGSY
jgi:hypothetical protein